MGFPEARSLRVIGLACIQLDVWERKLFRLIFYVKDKIACRFAEPTRRFATERLLEHLAVARGQ